MDEGKKLRSEAPIIDIARPYDQRTEWRMLEMEKKLRGENDSGGKVNDEALREILEEVRKAPKSTRRKKQG